MKREALEAILTEIAPLHENVLEPVSRRIRIPFQMHLKGMDVYPSASKRMEFMGFFYESLNRGLYGGKLNDVKFDIDFYSGENGSGTIKPDIVDDENNIHWESKSNVFDKDCEIMKRQLEGYRSLQYTYPEKQYLLAIYRHKLLGIKKEERTLEEVFDELLKGTAFSLILPLSVVLKIYENPVSGDVKMARNYVSKNNNWPDCLCIKPHTINRFLMSPLENFELLGFDPNRFEIERFFSPSNMTMNRRKLRQFPIVKIVDTKYNEWVDEFRNSYEIEMQKAGENGKLEAINELSLEEEAELPF